MLRCSGTVACFISFHVSSPISIFRDGPFVAHIRIHFAFGMFGHSIHDSRIASHRASHCMRGVATAALGAAVRRQLTESFCFQVADFLQFGGRLNQPVICLFRGVAFISRALCALCSVFMFCCVLFACNSFGAAEQRCMTDSFCFKCVLPASGSSSHLLIPCRFMCRFGSGVLNPSVCPV